MSDALAAVAERYWDALMEANPTSASLLGDHRFDDRMEDVTAAAAERLAAELDGRAAEAEAIDAAGLGPQDRITRSVLVEEARVYAAALRDHHQEFLVDPMLGPHIDIISYVPQLTPVTEEHARAYVAKAGATGGFFDDAIAELRNGVAAGRVPVASLVEKVLGQLDDYLASPITQDPFLQIAPPPGMDEAAVDEWRDSLAGQVRDVVRPAMARYRDAVRADVLPAARPDEQAGLCWLPGGDEFYAKSVHRYTSLDLAPAAIHQLGLDEIARLEDEYREQAGGVLGTVDLAEIYARLRDDPALRFKTADQVREQAERALARANEATPAWFGRQPEAPCVVQPIPEVGGADATLAYYLPPAQDGSRPGIFFINLTEPETRTRYESEALAFHESVPGHHFQLAIAQELEELPMFRRNSLQTAYVEGWGLYTERLADEMGLYSGEIERLGMLSFDSWRACRLVVDTGMHAMGWSRQHAVNYMLTNSPQAPNNVRNEIDRYIGYGGQALAYKLGQREIFRLRDESRRVLGDRFDIKGFHDTVLGSGPLPLPVLAEVVEQWAAA